MKEKPRRVGDGGASVSIDGLSVGWMDEARMRPTSLTPVYAVRARGQRYKESPTRGGAELNHVLRKTPTLYAMPLRVNGGAAGCHPKNAVAPCPNASLDGDPEAIRPQRRGRAQRRP